jgi:HSP20 family molecular chaperone IbpA
MIVERPGFQGSGENAEIEASPNPSRPGWFLSEDVQSLTPNAYRGRNTLRPHAWRPPTDVYETEETLVVRIEIAGMDEKDFTISLTDRTLTVRGVRQETPERRAYYQAEIFFGEFFSEVELPVPVQAEKVSAEYQTGFLWLVLPKEQPLRIRVTDE